MADNDTNTGLVLCNDSKTNKPKKPRPTAMAFFHGDGLVPSYNSAKAFAGEGGHIATMPDIWNARISQLQDKLSIRPGWGRVGAPWDTYYTTTSAEYMGRSRGGNLIIIVAHGIGPMRDLDWMMKAYRHQFRDKTRDIRGGRVEREYFLDLESGRYGDVAIVDLGRYLKRYPYPFLSGLSAEEAHADELFKARLGSRWMECLQAQVKISDRWHEANKEDEERRLRGWRVTHPRPKKVFQLGDNSNWSYKALAENRKYLERATEGGKYAIAHLLSTGGVQVMHYCSSDADYTGVISEVDLHTWHTGTRFVGVLAGSDLTDIHPGPNNLREAIRKHWERLGVPVGSKDIRPRTRPFYRLDDEHEFALYQDDDSKELQTSEPEFKVRGAMELGRSDFVTPIDGYHGFFRYSPNDVRRIAPREANAFCFVNEPTIVWNDRNPTHHTVEVAFFRANVDTKLRLPTEKEILRDFDLTMKLALDEF